MGVYAKNTMKYWLLDHPTISRFRWSSSESWGSTWSFLVFMIFTYITVSQILHVTLKFLYPNRAIPLGLIPSFHSLIMSLISVMIFVGMLFSAMAEMNDTRWLWRRTRNHYLEWLLCFPLGIRPSGRVFFWSYVFYLSRFLHLFRTVFAVLRHRRLSFSRLFNHSMLLIMSFLWLEFSQSFHVLAILFSTVVYAAVYGHRFCREIGLLRCENFLFTVSCQILVLSCNLVCHVGVFMLHLLRGGCNGIGAWMFNSVLNAAILFLFLKSHVNMFSQKKKHLDSDSTTTCIDLVQHIDVEEEK